MSQQTILISGPAGQLEVLTAPGNGPEKDTVAVICHPHPVHGGTMNNKVVSTLHRVCRDLHIPTVRFNFRGVGQSEGEFAQGVGEIDDLMAVLRWTKEHYPDKTFWLAGFSFGSYIAAAAATRWPCEQLISIAPPVHHYDFSLADQIHCPWIVVQGDEDDVVPPDEVYQWLDGLAKPPQLIRISEADHFFHGQLLRLRDELSALL